MFEEMKSAEIEIRAKAQEHLFSLCEGWRKLIAKNAEDNDGGRSRGAEIQTYFIVEQHTDQWGWIALMSDGIPQRFLSQASALREAYLSNLLTLCPTRVVQLTVTRDIQWSKGCEVGKVLA